MKGESDVVLDLAENDAWVTSETLVFLADGKHYRLVPEHEGWSDDSLVCFETERQWEPGEAGCTDDSHEHARLADCVTDDAPEASSWLRDAVARAAFAEWQSSEQAAEFYRNQSQRNFDALKEADLALASERSRADRLEQDLERLKAENERLERALAEEHDAVQYLRAVLSILIPEDYEAADGSIEAALVGGKWLWTEDEAHSVLDGLPRLIGTRPTLLASVEENRSDG